MNQLINAEEKKTDNQHVNQTEPKNTSPRQLQCLITHHRATTRYSSLGDLDTCLGPVASDKTSVMCVNTYKQLYSYSWNADHFQTQK